MLPSFSVVWIVRLILVLIVIWMAITYLRSRGTALDPENDSSTKSSFIKSSSPQLSQNFYSLEQTYPELRSWTRPEVWTQIREEMKQAEEKWEDWPEYDLWDPRKEAWQVIPLYGFDTWTVLADYFPNTVKYLKTLPQLRTATFSRLGPKTKLQVHRGWGELANRVLRCHLGLVVPESCGIYVEGEVQWQKEGEWLVFDDSRRHSGLNYSDQERIVLLIDLKRPEWVVPGDSPMPRSEELQQVIQKLGLKKPALEA